MSTNRQLTPDDVRRMARDGNVVPAPTYHAHEHGFKHRELRAMLAGCFRVRPDDRPDHVGAARHPGGFVAWCQDWQGTVRVDFNLQTTAEGESIAIVTAMRCEE